MPQFRLSLSSNPGLRLQGSALLYTLSISLLIGLLLSSLLLLYGYSKIGNDTIYFKELAYDNLESGVNKVLYGRGPKFGRFEEQLFGSDVDSFYVDSRNWGLYGVLHAEGVHGPARTREAYLFGLAPQDHFEASLFLTDRGRPLMLAGKTRLQGLLYLPEAGVRRAYVGRQGFEGRSLYEGEKHSSKRQQATVAYGSLSETRDRLRRGWEYGFSGQYDLAPGDSMHGDWTGQPILMESGSRMYLNDLHLSGNIIVAAPEIWVGATARLDNVLLFGNQIFIENGFEGRLQAFATDTLEVGEDCRLAYPSTLLLSNPANRSWLRIGAGTEVEGMVLHDARFIGERAQKDGYTQIEAEATIVGNVYVPYNLDLKGTVIGNVICTNFFLRTPGASYENHLLGATITNRGLSDNYAMGLLLETPERYRIIDRMRE